MKIYCKTVIMFDSYLEKCADGYIYFSKYVHRYDKSSNLYKLSLLPILPSIGVHGCLNDVFLTTTKKVVGVRQIGFSFTSIPPGDSLIVLLQKDAFRCLSYIKEIFPERLSCYHHLLPKLKDK